VDRHPRVNHTVAAHLPAAGLSRGAVPGRGTGGTAQGGAGTGARAACAAHAAVRVSRLLYSLCRRQPI